MCITVSEWADYSIRDLTVNSVLTRQARSRPNKVYIRTTDGQALTYLQVHLATNRIANWLSSIGIGKGAHVAVFMENELECLLSHIALAKLGAVSIPINSTATGAILAHCLSFSDAVAVIATADCASRVAPIHEAIPQLHTLIIIGAGKDPAIEGFKTFAFDESAAASEGPISTSVKFSDLAFIMFTSGTTGPSKGVMFPQARAFMWDEGLIPLFGVSDTDCYFVCTPLSHATGLFSGAWTMMALGGSIGLTRRFSASQFWEQVRSTGSTYTTLLGAMVSFIEAIPPQESDRENPMRLISAAPYPPTWESFEARFSVKLSIAYGLSDHSVPTRLESNPPRAKRGSAGRALQGFELIIVDQDDIPLPPGQVGECLIRAQRPWHSSLGYYKLAEQSLKSHLHDWFHTGDRGYLDEDGYFWFVDRSKDSIRRLGENISSYEVEQAAGQYDGIAEIAAYPLAADVSEEEVTVSVVIRKDTTFNPRDFIRYCMTAMPKYMVPRFVHVCDALPRNLNQRVEKYKLREWAECNREAIWDRESDPEFARGAASRRSRPTDAASNTDSRPCG